MAAVDVRIQLDGANYAELERNLGIVAEAMVQLDMVHLETHPDAPCCLDCGDVQAVDFHGPYRVTNTHTYRTGSALTSGRRATCLDAAAWHVAVARRAGKEAFVVILPMRNPGQWHAVAQVDGVLMDPQAELVRSVL